MKSVTGLFERYEDAEEAIECLDRDNFDADGISVITRKRVMQSHLAMLDPPEDEPGSGAIRGAALGGLTGLLVGLGATAVPEIGPVIMRGPLAAAVSAAAGGVVGALLSLGIPRRLAYLYRDGIQMGQVLVAIQNSDRLSQAKQDLFRSGANYIYISYGSPTPGHRSELGASPVSPHYSQTATPYVMVK